MGWGQLSVCTLAMAVLLLAGSLATGGGPTSFAEGNSAQAVRIDTDPTGNTADTVAGVEICREVSSGDTFDVDIAIEDVTDLIAFDTALYYDKNMLAVVDRDVDFFLAIASGSNVRDQSDASPDADGYYGFRGLDTSKDPATAESGSGVLGRVTLEAVGPGVSTLSVNIPDISPAFHDSESDYLEPFGRFGTWLGDVFDARIAVDEPCPSEATPIAPPPGVTPAVAPGGQSPSGQTPDTDETQEADATPGPDTEQTPVISPDANTADSISIDADPNGNTAASLGGIDACREVAVGEQFDIDLTIENVSSLAAFSITLTYEEGSLEVAGEDVDLFLGSAPTSDVADNSDSVPDSDGVYEVRAFELSADPDAVESGSGVLARITLEAASSGVSTLSVKVPSIGPILTDGDGDALEPADEFGVWLGDVSDAQIAVDEECPPVTTTPTPTASPTVTDGEEDGDGDDLTVVWIIVGIAAGIAALSVGFFAWRAARGRVL